MNTTEQLKQIMHGIKSLNIYQHKIILKDKYETKNSPLLKICNPLQNRFIGFRVEFRIAQLKDKPETLLNRDEVRIRSFETLSKAETAHYEPA